MTEKDNPGRPDSVPINDSDIMKVIDQKYAHPRLFESIADIKISSGRFFFNSGHARHEMGPYLIELITEYGAIPYRVQKPARKGEYEIFIGMEPAEIFRWVRKQMSAGNFSDVVIDRTQTLVDFLPEGWLRNKFNKVLSKRIQDAPLADVLFAFRQQVEQVPSPESYVSMIEGAIEDGEYAMARKNLEKLKKVLFNMNRQYAAAASFFSRFFQYIEEPGVGRRMHTTPRLQLELQHSTAAYELTKKIVLGARDFQVATSRLEAELDELDPPVIASPEEKG